VTSALLRAAPVTPDADEARRWLLDELAEEVYRQAEPSVFARAVGWLLDRLQAIDLPDGPGSQVLLVTLLLVVAAGVVVALALAGPVRLGRRRSRGDVFQDVSRTAVDHRRAADEHAAAGRWADAVQERFRAIVRSLEERALIRPAPGTTADEVANEAALVLPGLGADLRAAARLFDDVRYGGRPAADEHDARLRRLDEAVAAARPALADATGSTR
jgi:hypothetical protein